MKTEDAVSIIKSISSSLRDLGVKRVSIFGSTARGDARDDSDVDLLIEFSEGHKSFDSFMDVADVLESAFPVSVDVLTPEALNPARRFRILSESVYYEITP